MGRSGQKHDLAEVPIGAHVFVGAGDLIQPDRILQASL